MVDNDSRESVRRVIRRVLAATCACREPDFDTDGVLITQAGELPGRLRFPVCSRPLLVVTMGAGVVVSCHAERVEPLRAVLGHLPRDAIFSATTIAQLARLVEPDGQLLAGPDLKYACSRADFRPAAVPAGVEVTLVEEDGMAALYRYRGFGAALSYRPNSARPERLASVAARAGQVVGIAAASADADDLWQIGVEVSAGAQGSGIGRALVSRLTEGILDKGKIPYYTTVVSNIRSRSLAIGLGYWPAWTELYARDRQPQASISQSAE